MASKDKRKKKSPDDEAQDRHSLKDEAAQRAVQEQVGNEDEDRELFAMPDTPISKACKEYVAIRRRIQSAKLELEKASKQVSAILKEEGREKIKYNDGTENYLFVITKSEEELKCQKITKDAPVTRVELAEK